MPWEVLVPICWPLTVDVGRRCHRHQLISSSASTQALCFTSKKVNITGILITKVFLPADTEEWLLHELGEFTAGGQFRSTRFERWLSDGRDWTHGAEMTRPDVESRITILSNNISRQYKHMPSRRWHKTGHRQRWRHRDFWPWRWTRQTGSAESWWPRIKHSYSRNYSCAWRRNRVDMLAIAAVCYRSVAVGTGRII